MTMKSSAKWKRACTHLYSFFNRKADDLHCSGNDERAVGLACISWVDGMEWARWKNGVR